MKEEQSYIQDISEIRNMMERSSRFISLSGLSGVFAGIFAIAGAISAYYYLDLWTYGRYYEGAIVGAAAYNRTVTFFVMDALAVLILSLSFGIFLTTRNARREGLKTWDKTAGRLLINLVIPLLTGGIFCLALFHHGYIGFIAPAMLLFYGLALINGSKYTFNDIRYLGICELTLGLISSFYLGYGLVFWTIGFGVLHIIYGAAMYFKYERK